MKYSPVILILLLVAFQVNAQVNKTLEKANALFKDYQYSKAIPLYEKLAAEGNTKVYRRLAECYNKINDSENAEKYFALAVEEKTVLPETIFSYGQVLMQNQKYKDAAFWFEKYKKLVPGDVQVKKYIEACNQANNVEFVDQPYLIYNMPFNSPYSDFSGSLLDGNKVVFTSSRPDGLLSKKDQWTNESYLSMFVTNFSLDSTNANATKLKGVNTMLFNDGPGCFDSAFSKIYFTRNNVSGGQGTRSKSDEIKLKIYEAHRDGETSFGKIRELEFNGDEYSCAYPSISLNGMEMYFTSDRAGGYGGKDLYVSYYDKRKQKWGRPENLGGKINTAGDERFPFIHPNGNLFFSSDGHIGFGGLDIFVTIRDSLGRVVDIQNVGLPFNSSKDDFGFWINETHSRGFFSSDRPGGKGKDDIYYFTNADIPITITVLEADKPSINTLVRILDAGNKALDYMVRTDKKGQVISLLEPYKSYWIVAEKGDKKIAEQVTAPRNKNESVNITLVLN